jgi:hypothetical protein
LKRDLTPFLSLGRPITLRAIAYEARMQRAREARESTQRITAQLNARYEELLRRCIENAMKNGVSNEQIRTILNGQRSAMDSVNALRNTLGPHMIGLPGKSVP